MNMKRFFFPYLLLFQNPIDEEKTKEEGITTLREKRGVKAICRKYDGISSNLNRI